MLRRNIDYSKKLVNGRIGNITNIISISLRLRQVYEKDITKVGIDFDVDGKYVTVPIFLWFPVKWGHSSTDCRMLPLLYYVVCKIYCS